MLYYSAFTSPALEDTTLYFLVERWEAQHAPEVRILAEAMECVTHGRRCEFPEEFGQIDSKTGALDVAAVAGYCAAHGITDAELAAARAGFREINGDAPAHFAGALLQSLTANPLKPAAARRHAETLRAQAAALDVVRTRNSELKAFRRGCAEAGRFTPADKQQVYALVVRQVTAKATLDAANDAVRVAKAGIKEAAIADSNVAKAAKALAKAGAL